jgi:hypothetical protein
MTFVPNMRKSRSSAWLRPAACASTTPRVIDERRRGTKAPSTVSKRRITSATRGSRRTEPKGPCRRNLESTVRPSRQRSRHGGSSAPRRIPEPQPGLAVAAPMPRLSARHDHRCSHCAKSPCAVNRSHQSCFEHASSITAERKRQHGLEIEALD